MASKLPPKANLSRDEIDRLTDLARQTYGTQGEASTIDSLGRVWRFRIGFDDPAGLDIELASNALPDKASRVSTLVLGATDPDRLRAVLNSLSGAAA